jgi:hypothetical protein
MGEEEAPFQLKQKGPAPEHCAEMKVPSHGFIIKSIKGSFLIHTPRRSLKVDAVKESNYILTNSFRVFPQEAMATLRVDD